MKGTILKGVGSFYSVLSDDNKEFICKARGKFRKDKLVPIPGDKVEFDVNEDKSGYILSIYERKNFLIRPAAANIDNLIIVCSASVPEPDFLLIDKLLIRCEISGITPIIVINKCDLKNKKIYDSLYNDYLPCGYKIIEVSAVTEYGISELKDSVIGKISCLAGQSAVGKSSIMNAIMPGLELEVGNLSRKTDRGKHTTRHAELWRMEGGGGIFDTPGFSLLETDELEPEKLSLLYPEMKSGIGKCRFAGCLHISEPDCEVKRIISAGKMSDNRYERYKTIINELKEMRKHKYD